MPPGALLFALLLSSSALLPSCVSLRASSHSSEAGEALRDALYTKLHENGDGESETTASDTPTGERDGARSLLPTLPLSPLSHETASDALSSIPESQIPAPPDPYAGVSVTFLAAGDNLIHPNLYLDAESRGNGEKTYDFLPLYQNVASLVAAADFAYLNQETLMAGDADYGLSGWPTFNSPQQLGFDLVEVGFDIISMANNHMLDKGASGYEATLDFWHTQPVTLIGGYYNEADAAEIRTVEKDGITIALLAYTYGTNGLFLPASSELSVPYLEEERILRDLANAENCADFTIVSVHWGVENTQEVTEEQRQMAKLLADNGADVILGSHSHTLQPLTFLQSSGAGTEPAGKDVLCIYSLGNFVSGMSNPVNMVGGMLSFTISGDGEGGLCTTDVHFTPTVTFYGADWANTHLYLLEEYTDEIAALHGVQYQGGYLSPEKAREYVTNVIPEEFLLP